jgi:hypothetical protein
MGIEPTSSAWKAEVLPLNYARQYTLPYSTGFPLQPKNWWRGEDSNLRRQSRQIYSLIPLAAREPLPDGNPAFSRILAAMSITLKIQLFRQGNRAICFPMTFLS